MMYIVVLNLQFGVWGATLNPNTSLMLGTYTGGGGCVCAHMHVCVTQEDTVTYDK